MTTNRPNRFFSILRGVGALVLVLGGLLLTGLGCTSEKKDSDGRASKAQEVPLNTLSEAEKKEGWMLLFDGESFEGWIGLGRDTIPKGHWAIEDGTIRKIGSGKVPKAPDGQPLEGGDIMTKKTYRNFELKLDWKASKGGNSGIKYNVSESLSTSHEPTHAALGFEYQLLDDRRHPDAETASHRAAALYDLLPPNASKALRPVGVWNQARVVFHGNHGEHWLNGVKVLEYDLGTERMNNLLERSKYSDTEGFATRRDGHIVLQDHGDDFWFRDIKIRTFPTDKGFFDSLLSFLNSS